MGPRLYVNCSTLPNNRGVVQVRAHLYTRGMPIQNHFEKFAHQKGRKDWNFNILPSGEDVERMAAQYAELLKNFEGLHPAIPAEWLHITILRVGFVDDFTEEEMLQVADVLAPKLAALEIPPEFVFGGWWQHDSLVTHISPEKAFRGVHAAVVESLQEVITVKPERVAHLIPGQIYSHMTFNYTQNRDNEVELAKFLGEHPIDGASFAVKSLHLIQQWPAEDHYEWEVVREIPIGVKKNEPKIS